MPAYLICGTSGSGVPIFSRKKGNFQNLPFSIVGSLNVIHMFGKPFNIEILNSLTDDYAVVWKEFENSIVLIGIASGCSMDILSKLLESVFNAIVLIVGIEELKKQRNIERLKRELKVCYTIVDSLLDSLDTGDSSNEQSSHLSGYVETILFSENHLLQIVLEAFIECVDSTYGCVLIAGKIAVATESWWSLHPDELRLLSLLAVSDNTANSKDIPIFLPYKSPTVAFRFIKCTLVPEVQLCCICGANPQLSDIEHSVTQCFKSSTEHLNAAVQCSPRNFPANCSVDGSILGLLLVNTTAGKYMLSKNPQQTSSKRSSSSSHRVDILRTFFYQSVMNDLLPCNKNENKLLDNSDSSIGSAIQENKLDCDSFNIGTETFWCSEYHKCHAAKIEDNILCVLYSSSVPSHTMRLVTRKTLKLLLSDKRVCW